MFNSMMIVVTVLVLFLVGGSLAQPDFGNSEIMQRMVPTKIKLGPQEMMVDITNKFATKILYLHSMQNKNNFAFSPCGLVSVLIALYEGSEGKSAIELHQSLELPWERDLTRVGFRDIHRRLRTYFYHQENILSGLSLSRENVTIRPEYETILRFYGYEVEGLSNQYNNMMDEVKTTTSTEGTTTMMVGDEEETTTEKEDPTTTMDMTTTPELTTTTKESEPTTTEEVTSTTVAEEEPTTTTTEESMSTTQVEEEASTSTTTEAPVASSVPPPTTDDYSTAPRPSRGSRQYQPRRNRRAELIFNVTGVMRIPRSPIEYEISGYDVTPNYFFHGTPNPPHDTGDYDSKFSFQPHQQQSSDTEDETVIHFFYINHFETIQVPYKFYNTILKYAYIESIRSSVLELQLDSDNYNMMIILPDYEYGLENLVASLKSPYSPSLREIKSQMVTTWVKAIVPKFNLRGNIVLTGDLQDMGIIDIFEPTRADFTPMTEEELIYARHVEQSVKVNIRTQSMEQLKRQTTYFKSPVEISINHPFLFFIIDTDIDLAIISGRILNPINSRIQ